MSMLKNRIEEAFERAKEKAEKNPEGAYKDLQKIDQLVETVSNSIAESIEVDNQFEDLDVKDLDNVNTENVKKILEAYEEEFLGDQ